jgi:hypothetical protein
LSLALQHQRNKFMLFDSSGYVSREGENADAVFGVRMLPPISIRLHTSAMTVDESNTGVVVRATSAQGAVKGAEALVVGGVATFTDLMFTGSEPHSAVLTFTAGTQGDAPVQGNTLLSGAISVNRIMLKHQLAFAPQSFVQRTVKYVELKNDEFFVIPSIIVQVKDSARQIDSSPMSEEDSLQMTTSGGINPELSADTSRPFVNGIASFINVKFKPSKEGKVTLKFTFNNGAQQPVQLESGEIRFEKDLLAATAGASPVDHVRSQIQQCKFIGTSTTCPVSIKFADEFTTQTSFVYKEGQEFSATVGAPIPLVRVTLADRFGRAQDKAGLSENAPVLVAYTGEAPGAESLLVTKGSPPANEGVYQNGEYVFSCLQFARLPGQLSKIRFIALDKDDRLPYQLMSTISTGFVTVVGNAVSNFDLRFGADSSISRPAQPFSAMLNMALPPIHVELVDSANQFDDTDSSTVIIASASSGKIDDNGGRELVKNGKATFAALKFSTVADEATITFTAVQTHNAVAGKSITTGLFTLTTTAIPTFELAFSDTVDVNNMVSHPFQPFVFRNMSDGNPTIVASIIVRDSAHQVAPVGAATKITIEVLCDEGRLGGGQPAAVIQSTTGCVCANFSSRITAQDPDYAEGTPFYLRYIVTAATGTAAGLIGSSLVVGPITVEATQQKQSTCAAHLQSPTVVTEFRLEPTELRQRAAATVAGLAFLMSVDETRVVLDLSTVADISRIDHLTLAQWSGAKVSLNFGEPAADDANQKSSAQLAADFVALRLRCEANSLSLAAAYYATDVKNCDAAQFTQSLAETKLCAAGATLPKCQCYAIGVIASWGQACFDDKTVASELLTVCDELSACGDAEIRNVCTHVLANDPRSLLWLWLLLGATGAVAIGIFVLYKRGYLTRRRTTLHKDDD